MIKASHSTIKRQCKRRGLKFMVIHDNDGDPVPFAAEGVRIRYPYNRDLFETDEMVTPISAISAFERFQDMEALKLRSRVIKLYELAEARRKQIERQEQQAIEDAKAELAKDLGALGQIRMSYSG